MVPTVELVVGSIDIELLNGYRTAFVSGPESGGCSVVNAVNGSLDIQMVDPTGMTFELAINDTLSLPNVVAVDNFYATPCSEGATTGGGSGVGGGATGGSGGGSSTGSWSGRVPLQHRTSDAQCSVPPPPGDCPLDAGPAPSGGCASDSDCTAGMYGRCSNQATYAEPAQCSCIYTNDACLSDTACSTGQTCACQGSPYTKGDPNRCVSGNCRVDGDCGPEGYCSPSPMGPDCEGLFLGGYYCHTAQDPASTKATVLQRLRARTLRRMLAGSVPLWRSVYDV